MSIGSDGSSSRQAGWFTGRLTSRQTEGRLAGRQDQGRLEASGPVLGEPRVMMRLSLLGHYPLIYILR